MKARSVFMAAAAAFMVLTAAVAPARARDRSSERPKPRQYFPQVDIRTLDIDLDGLLTSPAAVDTYNIVRYGFETMDWQGWTRRDYTAQRDTFFHVDDFSGLGGGDYGRLVPVEGTKSAWCGARPGDDWYLCNWRTAPGYGDNWDQYLTTGPVYFTGQLKISYHGRFDSEPGRDITKIELYDNYRVKEEVASYDGVVDTVAEHTLFLAAARTKIRFRFTSDSGWSDDDGLSNSDGAAIIDSITIEDETGLIDFEDFESAEAGAKNAGIWHAGATDGYGIYSGLYSSLIDKDPCGDNYGTQVIFFNYSIYPCIDYPGLYVTPFCTGPGGIQAPCQNEGIVSPLIDLTRYSTRDDENQDADIPPGDLPGLGGLKLGFTVYRDLPLENLVVYTWNVRGVRDGCPEDWLGRNYVNYGDEQEYIFEEHDIGDLVYSDVIQITLNVSDMCDVWFDSYGDCAEHTPAPYFDNVWVKRYGTEGPQWYVQDEYLFQDNFPGNEFDMGSWVRADMAMDINPAGDPEIRPGDSVVVRCASKVGGGIAEDGGGPRVYMHVKCSYIGPSPFKPDLAGASLEGTYGHYVSDDGEWTLIQGEQARIGANSAADMYMFDLNDSLLTRGYIVEYYFEAYDNAGMSSLYPASAATPPDTPYRLSHYLEFTCLPTLNGEILYVDDYHGIGSLDGTAQLYFYPELLFCLPYWHDVDRYDVNGPTSAVSSGPGSRARLYQLMMAYDLVVWDSGDLERYTITDGTGHSDKSNDVRLLIDWLEMTEHKAGLWVMGDNVASDLDGSQSPSALQLMSTLCGVSLSSDSYFGLTGGAGGGVVNPLVAGAAGGPMEDRAFCLFGGCPGINSFDVLDKTGSGHYALKYPSYGGSDRYAGIYVSSVNSAGYAMRTFWTGFSYMNIRPEDGDWRERLEFILDALHFFQMESGDWVTPAEAPPAYMLAANYPNPFNPVTTISFSIARKGKVSLRIYDVAGRLVRTMVDKELDAGAYSEVWDGRNNAGAAAASGVYFYRLDAADFTASRKMVLLR